MLQTTVNYLSMLENKRHNLVSEKQNDYQLSLNARDTAVREGALEETKRHNRETESISWGSLNETIRHNQATEAISAFDASTRRMQIPISQQQADAATMNAVTNRYAAEQQAGIGWANVMVNQQRADTAEQARADQFVAWANGWGVNQSQAQTAARNADVREKEYQWNVTYGTSNLEIQNTEAETHRMDVIWKNLNQTIHNTIDAADKAFRIASGWQSIVN